MRQVDKVAWITDCVRGKTFADVGGLWGTKNEMVSVALDAGATAATMIDIAETEHSMWRDLDAYLAAKGSYSYRKVARADASAKQFQDTVGTYDVVHCSGILYHLPDPMALLMNLRAITKERGILTSMTVPEMIENDAGTIDMRGGGALFAPGLDQARRDILQCHFSMLGVPSLDPIVRTDETWRFPNGEPSYVPWWWFLTPQTVKAMLSACDLQVLDMGESWSVGAVSFLYRAART